MSLEGFPFFIDKFLKTLLSFTMSTNLSQIQYIAEQCRKAGTITYKKMFGEYGIYCNGVIFGLVCNDMLFVRIISKGKKNIREIEPRFLSQLDRTIMPFPGAIGHAGVNEETLEDVDKMNELLKAVLELC
jgi:hypothetical protein